MLIGAVRPPLFGRRVLRFLPASCRRRRPSRLVRRLPGFAVRRRVVLLGSRSVQRSVSWPAVLGLRSGAAVRCSSTVRRCCRPTGSRPGPRAVIMRGLRPLRLYLVLSRAPPQFAVFLFAVLRSVWQPPALLLLSVPGPRPFLLCDRPVLRIWRLRGRCALRVGTGRSSSRDRVRRRARHVVVSRGWTRRLRLDGARVICARVRRYAMLDGLSSSHGGASSGRDRYPPCRLSCATSPLLASGLTRCPSRRLHACAPVAVCRPSRLVCFTPWARPSRFDSPRWPRLVFQSPGFRAAPRSSLTPTCSSPRVDHPCGLSAFREPFLVGPPSVRAPVVSFTGS